MRKRFLTLFALLLLLSAVPLAALADWTAMPYWISVDKTNERVTVYRTENNEPVYKWICSTGSATPVGRFILPKVNSSLERREAFVSSGDGTYFLWRTQIRGAILFHSWLYTAKSLDAIDVDSVNALGTPVSHGCVRLPVDAAKWIAQNCLPGTLVIIHKGPDDPLIRKMFGGSQETVAETDLADEPTAIALNLTSATVNKGETLTLTASLEPENSVTGIRWVSSNSRIAMVDGTGTVTGKASGTVTVSAVTGNALVARAVIEVNDPAVPRRLTIAEGSTVTMIKGETLQLNASVIPETAVTTLQWSSSSAKVADAGKKGLVTAKKAGTAVITCRTANGVTARITVRVEDPWTPTAVALQPSGTVTLNLGDTLDLTAVLTPSTARTTLTWTSSDKKTAPVSGGTVKALKTGTVTVSVKTANGKKASVRVKVVDPKIASGVTLSRTGTVTLCVGDTLRLNATVTPETAQTTLKWTSSAPKTASVDQGTVTAKKKGTARISVRTANGKKATVTVKVIAPSALKALRINEAVTGGNGSAQPLKLRAGESLPLTCTAEPSTARPQLVWSSDDETVATVSKNGTVSAVKSGRTVITVTADNGLTACVTVVVEAAVPDTADPDEETETTATQTDL